MRNRTFTTLVITCIACVVFLLGILVRNNLVHSFRSDVIDGCFDTPGWQDNIKIHDGVSYDAMVWEFWKPIKSFYPGEFLIHIGVSEVSQ